MNVIKEAKKRVKHADDALREFYEIRRKDHVPLRVKSDSEHPRKQKGFTWRDYLNELDYIDSPQFVKELREKSDEIRDRMEWYIKEEAATHTSWNFYVSRWKVFLFSMYDVWITRAPLMQIIILLVILNYYTVIGILLFLIIDCAFVFLFSHWCFCDMICSSMKNICFCYGWCARFLERRKITNKETIRARGWCCRYRYRPFHESVFEYALDMEYSYETWSQKLMKIFVAVLVLLVSAYLHYHYFESSSDVYCFYVSENLSTNVTGVNGTSQMIFHEEMESFELERRDYAIYEFIPLIYSNRVLWSRKVEKDDFFTPLLNCDYTPGYGFVNYWKGIFLGVLGILLMVFLDIAGYDGPGTLIYSRQLQKLRDCGVRFPKIPISWGDLRSTRTGDYLQTVINCLNILKIRMLKNHERMMHFEAEHLRSQLSMAESSNTQLNKIIRRQTLNAEDVLGISSTASDGGGFSVQQMKDEWGKEKKRHQEEQRRLIRLREKQEESIDMYQDPRTDLEGKTAYSHLDLDILESLSGHELGFLHYFFIDALDDKELELQESVSIKTRFIHFFLVNSIKFISLFEVKIYNLYSISGDKETLDILFSPCILLDCLKKLNPTYRLDATKHEREVFRWSDQAIRVLSGSNDEMEDVIEKIRDEEDLPEFTFSYLFGNLCCVPSATKFFLMQLCCCCFCFVVPEHIFDSCLMPDLEEFRSKFSRRRDMRRMIGEKRSDDNVKRKNTFYDNLEFSLQDNFFDCNLFQTHCPEACEEFFSDFPFKWKCQGFNLFDLGRCCYCCCGIFDTLFVIIRLMWLFVFQSYSPMPKTITKEEIIMDSEGRRNIFKRFLFLRRRYDDMTSTEVKEMMKLTTKAKINNPYIEMYARFDELEEKYKEIREREKEEVEERNDKADMVMNTKALAYYMAKGLIDDVTNFFTFITTSTALAFIKTAVVLWVVLFLFLLVVEYFFIVFTFFVGDVDIYIPEYTEEGISTYIISKGDDDFEKTFGYLTSPEWSIGEVVARFSIYFFVFVSSTVLLVSIFTVLVCFSGDIEEKLQSFSYERIFRSSFNRKKYYENCGSEFFITQFLMCGCGCCKIFHIPFFQKPRREEEIENFREKIGDKIDQRKDKVLDVGSYEDCFPCVRSFFSRCDFLCWDVVCFVMIIIIVFSILMILVISLIPLFGLLYATLLSNFAIPIFMLILTCFCCMGAGCLFFFLTTFFSWCVVQCHTLFYFQCCRFCCTGVGYCLENDRKRRECCDSFLYSSCDVCDRKLCFQRFDRCCFGSCRYGTNFKSDFLLSLLITICCCTIFFTFVIGWIILGGIVLFYWLILFICIILFLRVFYKYCVMKYCIENFVEKILDRICIGRSCGLYTLLTILGLHYPLQVEDDRDGGSYRFRINGTEEQIQEILVDEDSDDDLIDVAYDIFHEDSVKDFKIRIYDEVNSGFREDVKKYVASKKKDRKKLSSSGRTLVRDDDGNTLGDVVELLEIEKEINKFVKKEEEGELVQTENEEEKELEIPKVDTTSENEEEITDEKATMEEEDSSEEENEGGGEIEFSTLTPLFQQEEISIDGEGDESEPKGEEKMGEDDEETGNIEKVKEYLREMERRRFQQGEAMGKRMDKRFRQIQRRHKRLKKASEAEEEKFTQKKGDYVQSEEDKVFSDYIDPGDCDSIIFLLALEKYKSRAVRPHEKVLRMLAREVKVKKMMEESETKKQPNKRLKLEKEIKDLEEELYSLSIKKCLHEYEDKVNLLAEKRRHLKSLNGDDTESEEDFMVFQNWFNCSNCDYIGTRGVCGPCIRKYHSRCTVNRKKPSILSPCRFRCCQNKEESNPTEQKLKGSRGLERNITEIMEESKEMCGQQKEEEDEGEEDEDESETDEEVEGGTISPPRLVPKIIMSYVEQKVCTAQLRLKDHPYSSGKNLAYIQKGYIHNELTRLSVLLDHHEDVDKDFGFRCPFYGSKVIVCESCRISCHPNCTLIEYGSDEIVGYFRFECECSRWKNTEIKCKCIDRQYKEDQGLTKLQEPLEDYKQKTTAQEKQQVYEKLADEFHTMHHRYLEKKGKKEWANIQNTIEFKKKIRRLIDSQYEKHLYMNVLKRSEEELNDIDCKLVGKDFSPVVDMKRLKVKERIHALVDITKKNLERTFFDDYQEGVDLCRYFLRYKLYDEKKHPLPKTRLERLVSPLETLVEELDIYLKKGWKFLLSAGDRLRKDMKACCKFFNFRSTAFVFPDDEMIRFDMDDDDELMILNVHGEMKYSKMETELRKAGYDLLQLKRIKKRYQNARVKKHTEIEKEKKDFEDLEELYGYLPSSNKKKIVALERAHEKLDQLIDLKKMLDKENDGEEEGGELHDVEEEQEYEYEDIERKIEKYRGRIESLTPLQKILERRDEEMKKEYIKVKDIDDRMNLKRYWKSLKLERNHRLRRWEKMELIYEEVAEEWEKEENTRMSLIVKEDGEDEDDDDDELVIDEEEDGEQEDEEDAYEYTKKFGYEKMSVDKWEEKEIEELLHSTKFDYLGTEFLEIAKDGKSLENLHHTFELEDRIKDPKGKLVFRNLWKYIKLMAKEKEKFRYAFFVCLDKTIRSMPIEEMDDINFEDFTYNCDVLSDPKKLKEHFIKLQGRGRGSERIHVKIIVTENIFRPRQIMARKIISSLVSYIPQLRPEFGFFHTAIIVGGIYFQWTDSQLIIPKEVPTYSGAAFLAMVTMGSDLSVAQSPDMSSEEEDDLIPPEISVIEDQLPIHCVRISKGRNSAKKLRTIEEIEEEIAQLVVRWNTQYRYKSVKPMGIGGRNVGNCQDFVKEVCELLNVPMDPESGPLRHYLEKLRKKGKCDLTFKVSGKMKEDPDFSTFLTRKKYLFESHEELDDFVWRLQEAKPGWKFDYPEEVSLLKAFDRAFWLRHLKDPGDVKFKPSLRGCYFDDPRATKSII